MNAICVSYIPAQRPARGRAGLSHVRHPVLEAWRCGRRGPVVCGQVCDVSPNEAFVKALAGRCTREGLEPCHLPCVVEDALAGGLPGEYP